MATQFTPSQQKIIDYPIGSNEKRANLLVSASAGSGKTTTLSERVANALINKGVRLDQLLIITFTESAAEEMKNKILKTLRNKVDELRKEKGNAELINNLERQIIFLPSANISTIDSFAAKVIDTYLNLLPKDYSRKIEPGYRILADEVERSMAMDEVFEELLSEEIKNEEVLELTENFDFLDRIDGEHGFKPLFFKLYNSAVTRKDTKTWLEKTLISNYTEDYLYDPQEQAIDLLIQAQDKFNEVIERGLVPDKEHDLWANRGQIIKDLLSRAEAHKLDLEYTEDLASNWGNSPRGSSVKDENTEIKTFAISKVKDLFDGINTEDKMHFLEIGKSRVTVLSGLVAKFIEKYNQYKDENNLLDFNDLERLAFDLSKDQNVVSDMKNRFVEVMVDEFQDVNPLQYSLIENIGDGHLFMVGDIKQSIYRFRQAEPDLFKHNYEEYKKEDNPNTVIELQENFRSNTNVLNFSNLIFSSIMTNELGDAEYEKEHQLVVGRLDLAPNNFKTEFLISLLDVNDDKDDDSNEESKQPINMIPAKLSDGEIESVVKKIKQIKENDPEVKYSDFAVLSRSKTHRPELIKALLDENIPVNTSNNGGYLQSVEVSIILSYLNVIDNPHNDVDLVAVLRSPLFGFGEVALSEIRLLGDIDDDFFDALQKSENSKVQDFLSELNQLRKLSRNNQIEKLIWEIYERHHWMDYVVGLPDGTQREANVRAFYQRAVDYQKSNFIGLYRFIKYIDTLIENGDDLAETAPTGGDDGVILTTIHASKGLEYPYVFLMHGGTQFNEKDEQGKFIFSPEFGSSIQLVDRQNNLQYKLGNYQTLTNQMKIQRYSEEMRLLYVLLTRAQKQLFIVGGFSAKISGPSSKTSLDILNDDWGSYRETLHHQIERSSLLESNNYFSWIGKVFMSKYQQELSGSDFEYSINNPIAFYEDGKDVLKDTEIHLSFEFNRMDPMVSLSSLVKTQKNPEKLEINEDQIEQIKNRFDFEYAHTQATTTPSAITVTETINPIQEIDNGEKEQFNDNQETTIPLPKFMVEQESSVNKGTITHAFLQTLDWQSGLQEQIQNAPEEVIQKDIEWFVQTDLAKDILQRPAQLVTERSFSHLQPDPDLEDEYRLLHGKVDGFLLNKETKEIVLFDYKTNWVPANQNSDEFKQRVQHLVETYTPQLDLYQQILEDIYKGYRVVSKNLVLLAAHEIVNLPVDTK